MLKLIFLIRHAKSSWQNPSVRDIDRTLNDRGWRDAPIMAIIYSSLVTLPSIIVSSPAVRAYSTAQIFRDSCNVKPDIMINDNLYYGNHEDYLETIQNANSYYHSIALFGHNPKVEDFNAKIMNTYLGEVPTCAVFVYETSVSEWKEVDWDKLNYKNHFFPKGLGDV